MRYRVLKDGEVWRRNAAGQLEGMAIGDVLEIPPVLAGQLMAIDAIEPAKKPRNGEAE